MTSTNPPTVPTSTPLRESKIVAAVTFLSTPTVRVSSVPRKLKFLEESQGMTIAEIAEALRRVAPGSPEHQAIEQGVREGKTAVQSVAHFPDAPTPAAPTAAPTSLPTNTAVAPSATPAYNYPTPPGFIAGPPAYAGGPPTFYPIPAPAPPATSGFKSMLWTAAGIVGGVAAAGVVAKRAFGWEGFQPSGGQTPRESVFGQTLPSSQLYPGTTMTQPGSGSSSSSSSALVPASTATSNTFTNTLNQPLPSPTATSAFGASLDNRPSATTTTTAGEEPEEEEENEEKYLGAWLGNEKKRSYGKSNSATNDILATELHHMSEKLDQVIEVLRENQIELRKLSLRPPPPTTPTTYESTVTNNKVEMLLTTSIQTQNEMLATMKIMMAAQVKASKESAIAAASAASATSTYEPQPSQSAPIPDSTGAPSASPTPSTSMFSSVTPAPVDSTTAGSAFQHRPWPSASSDPLADGARLLEEALQFLRANNTIDDIKSSCAAMTLYIENLLNNLTDKKYRRILLTNSSYESRVRKVKGAEKFLLAAGFETNKSYIEWVLPDPTSETPTLASGNAMEGTGSGLIMDEQQKTKQLQTALVQLKQFQARLTSSDQLYESNAPTTTTVAAAPPALISQPSYLADPTQQQQPSVQFQQAQQYVPSQQSQQQPSQPQQPPPPQTSYSAYSNPSTAPPFQQQQQQLQPTPLQSPPLQQPQQVTTNLTYGNSNQYITSDPNQSQPQQQQLQPSYQSTQPFSLPNTPFHPQYQLSQPNSVQYPNGTQSYPNSPLPPPQFQSMNGHTTSNGGQYYPPPATNGTAHHQPSQLSPSPQSTSATITSNGMDPSQSNGNQYPPATLHQPLPSTSTQPLNGATSTQTSHHPHQPSQLPFPHQLPQLSGHTNPPYSTNGNDQMNSNMYGSTTVDRDSSAILQAAAKVNPTSTDQPPTQAQM